MNPHAKSTNRKTVTAVIGAVMVLVFSQTMSNAYANSDVKRGLTGTWMVTITPRICATGAPIPAATFEALYTFHEDGTMSAWLQNSLITVTRSPSLGVWERDRGWRSYSFGFVHLRYELSGLYSGRQEALGTLELDKHGRNFVANGSTNLFDPTGNPMGGGCSDSVGTRFDLDP